MWKLFAYGIAMHIFQCTYEKVSVLIFVRMLLLFPYIKLWLAILFPIQRKDRQKLQVAGGDMYQKFENVMCVYTGQEIYKTHFCSSASH